MSTCSLANTGLPPAQFLSATSVDASQLTILQQSYSSIFGCVRVRTPGSAITSPGSWFCSTPNDITSAGRAASCPVDIVEPACSTPYDIQFNPSGGTVTVSGCLQDIGTTQYYCYSRAQKVACTPRALQGLNGDAVNGNNGNTPVLNGEVKDPSSQNSSAGVIAGSVVGAVCVAAIGLFFYLRHRRRSQAAMKEISVENAKPRSAETTQHQNAMSEMTLNSIAVAPPQQYNTGSVSSVNGMVRISPERQDGEGLAERMGERPVDEIEGDVVDEVSHIIKH
ncbi:hypothetical protein BKA69DRAFT_1047451 [Paraphysoderma sedebokerense]|nr:hypothetical protein BKA69DRAFT_1047451 [Paraphysoderma sedebokerense]